MGFATRENPPHCCYPCFAMASSYNAIAGQSVERLAALSDGIFGVAMTLLLLDLHVPAKEFIHSEGDLRMAFVHLLPQLLVYLMSFITLGIFWVGQQTQLNHLERSNRSLTWIHLAFLFAVTIMPFSTRLLIEFMQYRSALLAYWANILLLGAFLYVSWGCAANSGLVRSDIPKEVPAAICRRIWIGQSVYAIGALLCIFNTYWSIGFIVLVQLNYAIAPRLWRGNRSEEN
ncbi:MAG: TMEM175 family protein [Candidatus Acidiferrum sp.]